MNANTFKARDFYKDWQGSLKSCGVGYEDAITSEWNRRLTEDFLARRADNILKRETLPLTIDEQLADGGLVSEDFSL